jgi:hypothetical protein
MAILDNENPIVVREIAFENLLEAGEVIVSASYDPKKGRLTLGLARKGSDQDFTHFGLALPIVGH